MGWFQSEKWPAELRRASRKQGSSVGFNLLVPIGPGTLYPGVVLREVQAELLKLPAEHQTRKARYIGTKTVGAKRSGGCGWRRIIRVTPRQRFWVIQISRAY